MKSIKLYSILLLALFSLFACQNTDESSDPQNDLQDDIGNPVVYVGDENASNEILYIFDYECPYCHQWIDEYFSTVAEWTEEHDLKFRTQSMAFLNDNSKTLSLIDQNLKLYYPDKYFDIFVGLMKGKALNQLLNEHGIELKELSKEPPVDINEVTEYYAEEFDIEYVPTIIVNGHKVKDPLSMKEIQSYFH